VGSVNKIRRDTIKEIKNTLYRCPTPKKKQQITMRAQLPGKVKILTEEEIFLFKVRRYKQRKEMI